MKKNLKDILIIADIEGSSGCWSYAASSYMTEEWFRACVDMTRDVHAVTQALFDAGVQHITVKDFHRTGYNLLPEMIDSRVKIVSGYRQKPVPGIGDPGKARAVMFLGMHAASGTDGFLAHTLTSRIEKLLVNELPLAEIELFAASLAPYGIRPLFFRVVPLPAVRLWIPFPIFACIPSINHWAARVLINRYGGPASPGLLLKHLIMIQPDRMNLPGLLKLL